MPKYNFFKIIKSKENELIRKLEAVGLAKCKSKKVKDYELTFYLSKDPEDTDIWWTVTYKEFIDTEDVPKNKLYFAVFILSNKSLCYAVSMGKSHFYIKPFCDTDFGINLAERIADETSSKLKNSKLFGGKKNKSIIVYNDNSNIEYDSGESIHYLKAKPLDKKMWGEENISFGNSVYLNSELPPEQTVILIEKIEYALKNQPLFKLPRAIIVSDENKIESLDAKLINAINSAELQMAEATISGVEFIFLDKHKYVFRYQRHKKEIVDELNIGALKEFLTEYDINLSEALNFIKIEVQSETTRPFQKELKYFLDFVDEERFCLIDGKWHEFSQNYIDYLKEDVDKITLQFPQKNFSKTAHENYLITNKIDKKSFYAEKYFNHMQSQDGYLNYDTIKSQLGTYTIEKFDLIKDSTLFFVKIGEPQKLAYVVDQSITTLTILQKKLAQIKIDHGHPILIKSLCLWLLLDRQSEIDKISKINSLIFLIKLSDWKRLCINAGFQPIINIGYVVD